MKTTDLQGNKLMKSEGRNDAVGVRLALEKRCHKNVNKTKKLKINYSSNYRREQK